MVVFPIETLFVTSISGNLICSVDTCFFFFSDSEQSCGKRYVHSVYSLAFGPCVKRFTNVLVKISRILSVNFFKLTYSFSVSFV